MAYWTVPFSLRAFTRIYEIDADDVVRSRPWLFGFLSGDEESLPVSEISVQSTGNRLLGNVNILKDGTVVFSWERVLFPIAKRRMIEKLAREEKIKHAAPVLPRQEAPAATRTVHEPEPTKRPLVPGPSAILDGKANKNSR